MTDSRKRRREKRPEEGGGFEVDLGLGGLFKGLGNFLELLSELAESGKTEISRTGEIKGPGPTKAVYGFTVRMGAGGKPVVERFGNVRSTAAGPVVEEEREPSVDIFQEEEDVVLIAELPGVEREDVRLSIEGDILTLTAERGERRYQKEILLPCPVRADSIQFTCRNGVLEVHIGKAARQSAAGGCASDATSGGAGQA
jgi:HSP20 family protein